MKDGGNAPGSDHECSVRSARWEQAGRVTVNRECKSHKDLIGSELISEAFRAMLFVA
ncbi:MAG TPA: hypothetical protein VIM64_22115 [Puia sp.]